MNQVTHVQFGLVRKAPKIGTDSTNQECGNNGLSRPQASSGWCVVSSFSTSPHYSVGFTVSYHE
jgi:hypothetical protein